MIAAFAGAVGNVSLGYLGLIVGALFAAIVYVILAVIVKFVGTKWINKVMPAAVIGPTVALIGLSLAGAAINDACSYGDKITFGLSSYFKMTPNAWVSLVCALVTFFTVVLCSVYGKKMVKLIPFIIGILAGYAVGLIFTVIGIAAGIDALKVIDFAPFKALVADGVGITTFLSLPDFTFVEAFKGNKSISFDYVLTVLIAEWNYPTAT